MLPLFIVLLAKATILLLAALGITFAMQRASAGARHLVWLVTLGTLLLVPALAAWAPLRMEILPATHAIASVTQPFVRDAGTQASAIPSAPGAALEPSSAAPVSRSLEASPFATALSRLSGMSGLGLLLLVWSVVALAICASLAYSVLTLRRIVRQARPLDTQAWVTPLWEVSDRLGLGEAPRLLRSDEAKMPFACGLLHPTIVLPAECEGWSLDRRRAVLLHELAHVRRRDLLGHTLGRLVCAAYWFHPLVWAAAKRLRAESERACDDLALSCGTRATDYAEHLLDIVTSVRRDGTPAVALAMARRKEFEGRMLAILDPEMRRSTPNRRQSLTLVATLALISVVVGAAAPAPRTVAEARDTRQSAARAAHAPALPAAPAAPVALTTPIVAERAIAPAPAAPAAPAEARADTQSEVAAEARVEARAEALHDAQVDERTHEQLGSALGTYLGNAAGRVVSATVRQTLTNLGITLSAKASDERPALLAKVLRTDTSATLRRVAAWGLGEYAEQPVAAEALATALRRDASEKVREMAAWALAQGGEASPGVTEALTAALRSDASVPVRATAAWSLGHAGDRAPADALTAALGDASADVRLRAAWALGNVQPKQAPRALIAMLSDRDPRAREITAWALFNIADPNARAALETALRNETDKEVQLADIRALAALGEESVGALRGLLESPDPRIKSMAVHALAGGHAAGPWPWPWPEPRPFP
jgi:beta-lactamase regulating signal transducer with metallopeptidase domain/HEAT repeat protein